MKQTVLYFSDCHIYGGSDRNIVNIANHMAEQQHLRVCFAYRYFEVYQQGVERDLSCKVRAIPLLLLSNDSLFHRINSLSVKRLAKKIMKLPFWLIQKSGFYTVYDYCVLRKAFHHIKPDLIHVNNGGYPASFICQIAIFAAKHSGVRKVIYHINNPAQERSGILDGIIDRKINQYVDCIITGSRQSQESLAEKRCFDGHKLVQIYNTIENPVIVKSRHDICSAHRIQGDPFILCEVAFLSERKGQIFILKAVRKIKELYPEIYSRLSLFLVGDGEDYDKLVRYCEANALTNVIFTGYQANYTDYIACSDLFLLPSTRQEDMPLVILSAMNLGRPIIAGEVAGISEEIENGKSGILVKVDGLDNLYLEIMRLVNDPEMRSRYGRNAKQRFDAYFSQPVVYAKIKSLYEHLGICDTAEMRTKS